MTRNRKPGWLLYSGDLGVISAEVLSADISFQATSMDVSSMANPVRRIIYGRPDVTFTAQITENLNWDRLATGKEQPHMAALLMLARKYPQEYRRLREAEDVLKALDW